MEYLTFLLAPLSSLLIALPLYLVWLVGIGIAMARRQEHPQLSTLAIATLGLLMALSIVGVVLNTTLPQMVVAGQFSTQQLAALYPVIGLCTTLLQAGLWACVLALIFGWRQQA